MGTKQQPGQFDCYAALEEDEPFFVLKATDQSAPATICVWAELYRERKQRTGQWNAAAIARYCEAHETANAMYAWRARREQQKDEPIPFTTAFPGRVLKLRGGSPYGKVAPAFAGGRFEPAPEQRLLDEMAVRGAQSEPPAEPNFAVGVDPAEFGSPASELTNFGAGSEPWKETE